MNVGALVSHFGTWTAKPAAEYTAGELSSYTGLVYVGSTFDEALPTALSDDVLHATTPVVWIDDNIWQLAARSPTFAADYGFMPWTFDFTPVARVDYEGTALTRHDTNAAGIMTYSELTTGQVLARATRETDDTTLPWAVRGQNVTYIDYLGDRKIPFSIALIPTYKDPLGVEHDGKATEIPLREAPALVLALHYAIARGGTIVMHGYTHQYGAVANPYDGVSADDLEFYRSHVDASDAVIYDGPVPEDSQAWADGRLEAGLAEIARVALGSRASTSIPITRSRSSRAWSPA
jgi:uncharacterized protein YdaL